MQKISQYLYPNRIELLADVATFNVEFTNVYQRNLKIYKGIDNLLTFDIKNADQKRVDLSTLTNIRMHVMDAGGKKLPNSPYTVTPAANQTTTGKGLATVTIPDTDLANLDLQYLKYSITCLKAGADTILYSDTRFGATGVLELAGDVIPFSQQPAREYDTFTAEIDLNGHPTYHSSAIPTKFYEAVPTTSLNFSIGLVNFVGSVWIEGTKKTTINTEAFKGSQYLWSSTYSANVPGNGNITVPTINIGDYQYFRVSYNTPLNNGLGAVFTVTNTGGTYDVKVKTGGTGYAIGSRLKVLGSALGGVDGINDLILTVTNIDASGQTFPSAYAVSSIVTVTWTGTAVGTGTYIVTGTNFSGTVDKVTVS